MLRGIGPGYARDLLTIKKITGMEPLTFIDVGGHYGETAKAAHYVFPLAEIHSFEPVFKSWEVMREKLIGEQYHVYNVALGNKTGKANFWDNEFSGASSLLANTKEQDTIFSITKNRKKTAVDMIRFDYLKNLNGIKLDRPVFLKIDVQGAEKLVLEGFGELIKQVDILQVEFSFKKFYEDQTTFKDIIKFINAAQLDMFIQLNVNATKKDGLLYCDLIFFRKKECIPSSVFSIFPISNNKSYIF